MAYFISGWRRSRCLCRLVGASLDGSIYGRCRSSTPLWPPLRPSLPAVSSVQCLFPPDYPPRKRSGRLTCACTQSGRVLQNRTVYHVDLDSIHMGLGERPSLDRVLFHHTRRSMKLQQCPRRSMRISQKSRLPPDYATEKCRFYG